MNKILAAFALLSMTALPMAAQTKVLVAKSRVPVSVPGDYHGGIAFPTACDEQGRLYVKLFKAGPGMVGPLFRLSSKGVVETEFDTSGALINRYAVRPNGGVIMMHTDGRIKFVDNFAPDGTRESSVALERPPTESREQEQSRRPGWGGKRPGAGRRPRDLEKWIAARGLKPATAAELLERADERRIWYRLLNSDDEAIVLRAVTYLTDRRDGRPAQQINITGAVPHFTPEEIDRARAVVRELVEDAPKPPLMLCGTGDSRRG